MEFFKKYLKNGFAYSGGILGVGVLCLYLCNRRYIPEYMTPVSYGVTCIGFFVTSAYLLGLHRRDSEEKSKEETNRIVVTQILEALMPALERHLAEQAEIRKETKEMEKKELLDGWEEQSRKISARLSSLGREGEEEKKANFERLLDRVDLAEALDPEIKELLRKIEEEIPKEQSEKFPSNNKEVPLPGALAGGQESKLPAFKVDPELMKSQYEKEVSRLLALASANLRRKNAKEGSDALPSNQRESLI